jgi:uncharacterized OB-fold protein
MTKLKHGNRLKKRQVKKGVNWCSYCDRGGAHDGGKCSNCGRVKLPKRGKKYEPLG